MSWLDTPRSQEEEGTAVGTRSVPGCLPCQEPWVPRWCHRGGDGGPAGKGGVQVSQGQELGHMDHTPSRVLNKHTLASLCAHTLSCAGTSRHEGPRPAPLPGAPTVPGHTLRTAHTRVRCVSRRRGASYKGRRSRTPSRLG